eukprot:Partr_v1_DN28010_c0_g1_i2_m57613 putative Abelson helper integration site 1
MDGDSDPLTPTSPSSGDPSRRRRNRRSRVPLADTVAAGDDRMDVVTTSPNYQPLPYPDPPSEESTISRRRRRSSRPKEELLKSLEPELSKTVERQAVKQPESPQLYLTVSIKRTDPLPLLLDIIVMQPYIRVSVWDRFTGTQLISSSDPRNALCTPPIDIRREGINMPMWNKDIQFTDPYDKIVNSSTVMVFELVDAAMRGRAGIAQSEIAWAFLQTVGQSRTGLNGAARLQFYRYRGKADGFLATRPWLKPPKKYPATLHVFGAMRPWFGGDHDMDMVRAMSQHGMAIDGNELNPIDSSTTPNDVDEQPVIPWRRMAGEKCQIPNSLLYRADTAEMGAFTVAFSSSGFYLAAACIAEKSYPIKIFDTLSGSRIVSLSGHADLVYELCWSDDERFLISSSSDGTVRVWDIYLDHVNRPRLLYILHHACFTYTAQLYPVGYDEDRRGRRLLVSGAYDAKVRIWKIDNESGAGVQTVTKSDQEITGHNSGITTLKFSDDGMKMFSGDNEGGIYVWKSSVVMDEAAGLQLSLKLLTRIAMDKEPSPCTSLQIHASQKRLLVQNKAFSLKELDIRLLKFTHELHQPVMTSGNLKGYPRAIYSPCGSFIVAPVKNTIAVLRADDLEEVMTYAPIYNGTSSMSLSFHPYDHIFSSAAIGDQTPVMVFTRDENFDGIEMQEAAVDGQTGVEAQKNEESAKRSEKLDDTIQQIQSFINKSTFIAVASPGSQISLATPTSPRSPSPTREAFID